MAVQPDQYDPNWKHIHIICRVCIKLPLDVYGIDASIDTKMTDNPHILLFHMEALDNGRKPDIGTLKKERGYIFHNSAPKALKGNYCVMSME